MEELKRENEHARDMASKYHAEHGLAEGTESVRMICKFNFLFLSLIQTIKEL